MRHGSLALLLFALGAIPAAAQWQWTQAVQCIGSDPQQGNSVALCPGGGMVVAGTFREQIQLGGLAFSVPGVGQVAGFVVEYDSLGNVNWAHKISSSDPASAPTLNDLAVDVDGNVIVLCAGRDSMLIDDVFATANTNGFANARTFMICKFDADGALVWAVDHEIAAFNNQAIAVAVTPAGDVWAVGQTGNDAGRLLKFDGTTGAELVNVSGIIGWLYDVRTDDAGNVYTTGLAVNVFTAGGLTCPLNQVYGGTTSQWVGKFDSQGNALWYYVPPQGGSGYNFWPAINIAATGAGKCFVQLNRRTVIGSDTLAWDASEHGLYLLDAAGAVQWSRRISRNGGIYLNDMVATGDDGLWITGTMNGSVDLIDTTVSHSGLLMLRYDAAGDLVNVVLGPNVTACNALATGTHEVAVTGLFGGNISFGTHALSGANDMFAARYGLPNDVGVEEVANALGLSAYPNPAGDALRLIGDATEPVRVEILDAAGRCVIRAERFNIQQDALDLSQFPEGLLAVRITSGNAGTTLRVIHLR